jgi:lysophospholipase L1-like esterase
MKRVFILFISFLLFFAGGSSKPNVLFIGDSITGRPNAECGDAEPTYPSLLKLIDGDKTPTLTVYPDCTVYGRTLKVFPGSTVADWNDDSGVCERKHGYQCIQDANAAHKLDVIVVMVGGNDMTWLDIENSGNADSFVTNYLAFIDKLSAEFTASKIVVAWYHPWDIASCGPVTGGKVLCPYDGDDDLECYAVNNQNRDYVIHTLAAPLAQRSIPVIDLFHQVIEEYPNTDDFLAAYGIGDFGHMRDYSKFWGEWLYPQLLAAIDYSGDSTTTISEATTTTTTLETSTSAIITTSTTTVLIDSDGDGIPDPQDNCPNTPSGPLLGTCMPGSDKAGAACNSDADCVNGCSSNGTCSLNQEDTNGDGKGDVCSP